MTPISIAVLAFSMSGDAWAAAMARGASTRPRLSVAIKSGLVFGIIEELTPLLGWTVGLAVSAYIAAVDHWVAFVLLGVVGGKMALESIDRRAFGARFGPIIEMVGGLGLIAIGTGILLKHTGVIG